MTKSGDGRFRVKVYELTEEGEWNDRGTGHVSFQVVQSVDAAFIFVHSEVDSSLLLESKVTAEDVYQRQGDTIITWTDPSTQVDLALSFAEAQGCQNVWERICVVRGVDPSIVNVVDEPGYSSQISLPDLEPSNLSRIASFFSDMPSTSRSDAALAICREKYLAKLVNLFKEVESTKNSDQLRLCFTTCKALVMLNETSLLEQMMNDDHFVGVFGMLEYDPENTENKAFHRKFIQETATFNHVVPISDAALVTRIHYNFRLQYLRDVVLPRSLDDATFATINNVIFFNGCEIAQQLQFNDHFLPNLFSMFKSTIDAKDRVAALKLQRDLVGLLQELGSLGRTNLQSENRTAFFQALFDRGILCVFTDALRHPDPKCKLAALDVMTACVYHNSSPVRSFILEQKPNYDLLQELVNNIVNEADHGVKGYASEILRFLLDPESMGSDQGQDRNVFLNIFYERFLDNLVVIFEATADTHAERNVTRHLVCELVTFFVRGHGYRIKYYLLKTNLVGKISRLMQDNEKFVALSAVRFIRACIGLKDDFYFKYMIKNDSFAPIIKLFRKNVAKNNLLSSAIIDLFEFIRKENIESLIAYIAETYRDDLSGVSNIETLSGLWTIYERNKKTYTQPNVQDLDILPPPEDDVAPPGSDKNSGAAKKPARAVLG